MAQSIHLGASTPVTKSSVWGDKEEIAAIIDAFDFSSMNVSDKTTDDYLHEDLAPSYGDLSDSAIKLMDEHLKVMITAVNKAIQQIPPAERSWDKVVSVLQQNPLIEPMDEGQLKHDQFYKDEENYFKFDGSPDPTVVDEVHSWFVKLVDDDDILKSTKIDLNVMGRIVAQTGATITNFVTAFFKHERHEKTMMDIGVLRYPDIDRPFFKVYRIQLVAWSDSTRIIFASKDVNGITGDVNVRRYQPRASVMDEIKKEIHDEAVKEANRFLNS